MADARTHLHGRKLLLCVCGGIAAYKAADLVRRLRDAGAEVQVAMTENAQRVVWPGGVVSGEWRASGKLVA